LLILFLIVHLAGNLLIYQGPEAINIYSRTLHSFGLFIKIAEFGLAALFLVHITFTAMVVIDNKKSRPIAYAGGSNYPTRSLATRLMPYTGMILILYVVSHLFHFTFPDASGPNAFVNGQNLGLYGLIVNQFGNTYSVVWYLVSMVAVGFHLVHALQSVFQTFGFNHPVYTPWIKRISFAFGILVSGAFASIPLYVWLVVRPLYQ
jgi:succinate dehydrogenase / fumarate reductase cytochrome b subunit